jgi:hypothetical protein
MDGQLFPHLSTCSPLLLSGRYYARCLPGSIQSGVSCVREQHGYAHVSVGRAMATVVCAFSVRSNGDELECEMRFPVIVQGVRRNI